MDFVFLRPGSEHSERALAMIRELLRDERRLLRVAIAYLTHPNVIDDLLWRRDERLPTRLLLNSQDFIRRAPGKDSKLQVSSHMLRLLEGASRDHGPLQIRSLGQGAITWSVMHHKFAVGPDTLITGSANWTHSALTGNYEWMARSHEAAEIAVFACEFDEVWETAQEIFAYSGKLRRILCPACGQAEGVDFESYGPFCTLCEHRFVVTDTDPS